MITQQARNNKHLRCVFSNTAGLVRDWDAVPACPIVQEMRKSVDHVTAQKPTSITFYAKRLPFSGICFPDGSFKNKPLTGWQIDKADDLKMILL